MQTIAMAAGVTLEIPTGALIETGATHTTITLYIYSIQALEPQPGQTGRRAAVIPAIRGIED